MLRQYGSHRHAALSISDLAHPLVARAVLGGNVENGTNAHNATLLALCHFGSNLITLGITTERLAVTRTQTQNELPNEQ